MGSNDTTERRVKMLIELTEIDNGRRVLVNADSVVYVVNLVGEQTGGTLISFGAGSWIKVSENLDEIAEKVQGLGGRVLLKGDAT
jgi:hypothetical protein